MGVWAAVAQEAVLGIAPGVLLGAVHIEARLRGVIVVVGIAAPLTFVVVIWAQVLPPSVLLASAHTVEMTFTPDVRTRLTNYSSFLSGHNAPLLEFLVISVADQ